VTKLVVLDEVVTGNISQGSTLLGGFLRSFAGAMNDIGLMVAFGAGDGKDRAVAKDWFIRVAVAGQR
jgi:hypothetical protein